MSLLVWLPLNGTLDNQGLSTVTVTNNGATVNDNGKIGKCYYFTPNQWIKISLPAEMTSIKNTTIAAWVKSHSTTMALGGISHDGAATLAGVTLYSSGWQLSGAGAGSWKYISGGTVANTQVWHHVACTIGDDEIITYLDGVKVTSSTLTAQAVTNTTLTSTDNFIEIGCDHPGGDEYFTGYINDFRVYDHALSAKEVKELSKGLVLHYKLDKIHGGNKNYYTGNGIGSLSNTSSVSNNGYESTFVLSASGGVRASQLGFEGKTGPWTASFDIKSSVNTTIGIDICDKNYATATYGTSLTANQWVHKSFIVTAETNQYNVSGNYNGFIDFNCGAAGTYELKNLKVEEGIKETPWIPAPTHASYAALGLDDNIEYDCSGYGYDGTISGALTGSSDSSRYNSCTVFPSGGYIGLNNIPSIESMKQCTFSFWMKTSTPENSMCLWNGRVTTGGPIGIFTLGGHFRFDDGAQHTLNYSIPTNTWEHYIMTRDTTNVKLYVNGVLEITQSSTDFTTVGTKGTIGASSANTSIGANNHFVGQLSDYRIYATALSADDVKELYHTAASIDNKGNVYAYELEEV